MTIEIRPADPIRDQPKILALWRRNFEQVPEGRFEWLYRHCPEKPAMYLGLWNADGTLVGGAGLVGRRLNTPSGTCIVGQAVDFVVDRAYRSVGPAIQLHRELLKYAEQAGITLLYGFPIPSSEAVLRRLDYQELGLYQRSVKPLRHYYLLKRYAPRWLALPAASILDVIMRLVARETWISLPKGWRGDVLSSPDDRLDELWHVSAPHHGLIAFRDRIFLEWRFFSQPNHRRRIFVVNDTDQSLRAYLVFEVDKDQSAHVLDFLAASSRDMYSLFTAFASYCRNQRFQSITVGYLGDITTRRILKSAGFVPRENKDSKVLVHTSDDTFLDPARWHLTEADHDT